MALDLSKVEGKRFIIVADTDGHGQTLAAAYLHALIESGLASPEDVAVVQHFSTNPSEPATTARGNIPALLSELAKHVSSDATVYLLDVPIPQGREEEFLKALVELTKRAKVVHVDHAFHSDLYAGIHRVAEYLRNYDPRLKLNAAETYLEPLLMNPSVEVYRLAELGTVLDMDMESIRAGILAHMAEFVEKAGEARVEPITVTFVRENYHIFVAVDSVMKFGRYGSTSITAVGNVAPKTVWLYENGVDKLVEEALKQFQVPEPKKVAEKAKVVDELVAVYTDVAPPGQGFKYASLLAAALDTPVVVVKAKVGPKPVIIVAPNSFAENAPAVEGFVRRVKPELFKALVDKGFSDEKTDMPRGETAYSIGVKEERLLDDAAEFAAKFLAEKLAAEMHEEVAKRIVTSRLTLVVADKNLAASVANVVVEALRMQARAFEERVERILDRLAARPAPAVEPVKKARLEGEVL